MTSTVERDGKSLKLKEKQLTIMFSLREEVCPSHLNSANLVGGLQLGECTLVSERS